MVQGLKLHASNAGGLGSVLGQGTKIPHANRYSKKNKTKQRSSGSTLLNFPLLNSGTFSEI